MKDVNIPLGTKIYTALNGSITYNSVAVPVFYNYAPDTNTAANYITFQVVNGNDISTINSADTRVQVRVTIHTYSNNDNSGLAADTIAGSVLQILYPTPQSVLDLSAYSMQMASTRLASDNSLDFSIEANRTYIDRVLIFEHHIVHST